MNLKKSVVILVLYFRKLKWKKQAQAKKLNQRFYIGPQENHFKGELIFSVHLCTSLYKLFWQSQTAKRSIIISCQIKFPCKMQMRCYLFGLTAESPPTSPRSTPITKLQAAVKWEAVSLIHIIDAISHLLKQKTNEFF